MKTLNILILMMLVCGAAFGNAPVKDASVIVPPDSRVLLPDNEFSLKVLQKMSAGGPEKNISVSPMSIRAAMTLAWAGAGGETAVQIQKALLIQSSHNFTATYGRFLLANELPGISIANSVWTQAKLLPEYSKICNGDLHAGVFQADFMTASEKQRQRINQWISDETNKMIPALLAAGDVDSNTRLVLVNAIYLKELWLTPFDKKATRKKPFHVTADKTVQADMMYVKTELPCFEDENLTAVRLEYKVPSEGRVRDSGQNRFASMIAIMPKDSTPEKLDKFIAGMTAEKFEEIVGNLNSEDNEEKTLFFPKFKLDNRYELKKLFEQMGVTVAFSEKADFAKMTGEPDLCISKIIHQAVIDVTESGTEAAAATAVVIKRLAAMVSEPIEFNRPFVFFIRNDKTGAIIFAGKVVDPTKK